MVLTKIIEESPAQKTKRARKGNQAVSIGLLALAAYAFVLQRADWRTKLAEAEAGEAEP